MRKNWLACFAAVLLIGGLIYGCGSNRDSGGDQTGPGTTLEDAQTLGITNCLVCHNTVTGVTDGWLKSRHANDLSAADKEALNAQGMYPVHEDDDEDGLGEGNPNYDHGDICFTCHDQLGDGRRIDEAIAGENERPIIGCESCHGGGQFHNGIAAGIPFPLPGPDRCGQCHGIEGDELFHSTSGEGNNVRRNISDTHFDNPDTGDIEGYNVKITEQTGCVDCHYGAHEFNLSINNSWANSAHAGHIKELKDAVLQTLVDALPPDPPSEDRLAVLTGVKETAVTGDDAEAFAGRNFAAISSCTRCHTATGARNYLNDPSGYDAANNDFSHLSGEQREMVYCWVCHSDSSATVRAPSVVPFPSGAELDLGDSSNVCMPCHQGRESGVTVAEATPLGTETGLSFINRHYFAAAAILFGTDATAGYEYAGRTYLGQNTFEDHPDSLTTCVGCHLRGRDDHHFVPELTDCSGCHPDVVTSFDELGSTISDDHDGDGGAESFQGEIDGLNERLLTAIQAYAADPAGLNSPIVYGAGSYPYWFIDTDADGIADPEEIDRDNNYPDFDAILLRAAYNYHSAQDPCGDIHNYKYVIQTLYDSLDDLDDGMQNDSPIGIRP